MIILVLSDPSLIIALPTLVTDSLLNDMTLADKGSIFVKVPIYLGNAQITLDTLPPLPPPKRTMLKSQENDHKIICRKPYGQAFTATPNGQHSNMYRATFHKGASLRVVP